jgi:3-oxoadipate enol-lactonase
LHIPDLPGYGSSASRGEATIEAYAERIAPAIPQGAALLGNGFGGFVAVAAAIRYGAKLGALIAAPALAAFPPPAREPFRVMAGKVREGGMAPVLDAAINRMFPPAFIAAHPDIVAERKRALAKADPQAFARACLALAALEFGSELEKIPCRTLVMAGQLDQTTPAALAHELARRIPGAEFQELKGCGHCPQLESPDLFVSTVRKFLQA